MSAAADGGLRAPAERRNPKRQRPIAGGTRAYDPPLTTRDVADYTAHSTTWVRGAIDEGVWTPRGLVKLRAETIVLSGRRILRIHLDDFIQFLRHIGWKRIPPNPRER